MKILVTFNEFGEITTLTRIAPHNYLGVGISPTPGMTVTEIELAEELEHLPLEIIHRDFYMDSRSSCLVRREKLPEEDIDDCQQKHSETA